MNKQGRAPCRGAFIVLLVFVGLATFAPHARAEAPEFLTRMPATTSAPGSGAGELFNPRDIAGNPATGRIYVTDLSNARINEYTAWGLFVKSWGWGVDDGSSALQICGPDEPEEAPPPELCRAGQPGSAAGQLAQPLGVAVDPDGYVYVYELGNLRVQKFSADGEFELMFGGGVNKTTGADICSSADVESGSICGSGVSGDGPSEFPATVGNYIAYSPAGGGAIVVGDVDRIQIFDLDGTYREEIPFAGPLDGFAGGAVSALAVDSAGSIYFSISGEEDVFKISPAGSPLAPGKPGESKFDVEVPVDVAVDHDGNVYVIDAPTGEFVERRVTKFDPHGARLIPTQAEADAGEFFPYITFPGPRLNGIGVNICPGSEDPGNLYIANFTGFAGVDHVSYVDAYGSGPIGCELPPLRPPVISEQYATSVGSDSATVQARINPKFWPNATYYVEYGIGRCAEAGCPRKAPLSPALLTDRSTNKALPTARLPLTGLERGTIYHFRFVAQSDGGGPVFGVDPDGEGPAEASIDAGIEGSFATSRASGSSAPGCSNDAFRRGPAAQLPDCRAYEMVSPLEKEGGDVGLWKGSHGVSPLSLELHQSDPSGERFTYSSMYAFGEPSSKPFISQYIADRDGVGWHSVAISPPHTEPPLIATDLFASEFQAFSQNLCQAWIHHKSVDSLTSAAIERYPNLYRRENCGTTPSYVALTTLEPPNREPQDYTELFVQGVSADGTESIFVSNDKLHPDAPVRSGKFELLLYESIPSGLRFVCYLPNGKPNSTACGAGTPAGLPGADRSSARNAISADGSRIFWTAYDATNPGFGADPGVPGQIYVRIDGQKTIRISGEVAPDPAWYWTAADDGSRVIFELDSGTHKDELYEFDVDAQEATLIAKGVEGPMGASEDASRLYFASTEDLDGTGPATKGNHSLYFYDANGGGGTGTFAFIMELDLEDIGGSDPAPGPIDEIPSQRAARVTANGLRVTFSSVAPSPSGYDNLEATSGERTQEVYRYDAADGDLRCISCNPTEARPAGDETETPFPAAARLQGWEIRGHAPRVISSDGSRVFFESFEALVPRDTNGTWDVYQWEEPGKGSCDAGDPTFGEKAGGCVDLISSGESPAKSTFLDADPSGDNVFFSTQSSLVGQDYGLNDVYVARVGGGFPEPQRKPVCEGDACQGSSAAPVPPTPSSSTYRGPKGDKAKRCPKGKRRVKRAGKVRCIKKRRKGAKGAKARRRAAAKRRAAR